MRLTVTTAAALSGKSRRTIGRIIGQAEDGTVQLAALRSHLLVSIDDETILKADAGDAQAQLDIGVMLLGADKPEAAMYWLQKAEDLPEAMCQIARAYLDGAGVERNPDLGMMWLHKAAAAGHPIARDQTAALRAMWHELPNAHSAI